MMGEVSAVVEYDCVVLFDGDVCCFLGFWFPVTVV